MPIGKYTLDEIYIGDEVIFDSNTVSTDHYWIVTGKNENSNEIYIKTRPEAIIQDTWIVRVSEVRVVIPTSTLRKKDNL